MRIDYEGWLAHSLELRALVSGPELSGYAASSGQEPVARQQLVLNYGNLSVNHA